MKHCGNRMVFRFTNSKGNQKWNNCKLLKKILPYNHHMEDIKQEVSVALAILSSGHMEWFMVGLERSQLVGPHSWARSPPKMAATLFKLPLTVNLKGIAL